MCFHHLPNRFAWIITATLSIAVPIFAVAESLPDMRPALVGSATNSLVNLIDTQGLVKKGQKHGAVFFRCLVLPSGGTDYRIAYGGSPDTEMLRQEVRLKLYPAKFIPAVYNH